MKQKLKKKSFVNKMSRQYHKKPISQLKIAKARINFLFKLAKENFKENNKLSDKYVKIARRIAMKYKIRLSSNLKKRFCFRFLKFIFRNLNPCSTCFPQNMKVSNIIFLILNFICPPFRKWSPKRNGPR